MAHNSGELVKEYFSQTPPSKCRVVSQIFVPKHGIIPVVKGDFHVLPEKVQVSSYIINAFKSTECNNVLIEIYVTLKQFLDKKLDTKS